MNRTVIAHPNRLVRRLVTAWIVCLLTVAAPAGPAIAQTVAPDRWSPPEPSLDERFPTSTVRWDDGVETTAVIPDGQLPLRMVVEEEVVRVLGEGPVSQGVAGWNDIPGSRFSAHLVGTVHDGVRQSRADGVNRIFLDESCTGGEVGWGYINEMMGDRRHGMRGGYTVDADIGICQRLLDRPVSVATTIRHEVGHLMGFAHADHRCRVMAASDSGCDSMTSAEHDAARYLYPRLPRLAGPTRFETAARSVYTSRPGDRGAATVVVVDGRGPTELPVTAAALAGALDAPMLLADSTCSASPMGLELQRVAAPGAQVLLVGPQIQPCSVGLLARGYRPIPLATPGALAQAFPEPIDTVFVVRGAMSDGNLPDGLTAAAAAGSLRAPILLADGGRLSTWSAEFLGKRPGIDRAIVVGGAAAIPDSVISELHQLGVDSERRGGQDRIATALAIASTPGAFPERGPVLVASSEKWPDAVAGSALGAARGWPVLLTPRTTLDPRVGSFLSIHAAGGFVMGGRAAIADDVALAVNARSG